MPCVCARRRTNGVLPAAPNVDSRRSANNTDCCSSQGLASQRTVVFRFWSSEGHAFSMLIAIATLAVVTPSPLDPQAPCRRHARTAYLRFGQQRRFQRETMIKSAMEVTDNDGNVDPEATATSVERQVGNLRAPLNPTAAGMPNQRAGYGVRVPRMAQEVLGRGSTSRRCGLSTRPPTAGVDAC
jgi:hypothetical protein